MRIALTILISIWFSGASATTYYVATAAGGGTNSNSGLSATYVSGTNGPWLTVQYAVDKIVGGDTILINDGTYSEGSLLTVKTAAGDYASMVYIGSLSADATKVTIKASGENTRINASNVTWSNLTFSTSAAADTCAIRLRNSTNGWFYGCKFLMDTPNATVKGVYVFQNVALSNQHLINCTVTQTGSTNAADGVYISAPGIFELTDSTVAVSGNGVILVAAFSGGTFVNDTIISTNGHAFSGNIASQNIYLTNVTLTALNGTKIGYYTGTSITTSNLVFSGCNVTGAPSGDAAIILPVCNYFLFENSRFSSANTHALQVGIDADFSGGYGTTGIVKNCSVVCSGTGGHGALIGDRCGSVQFYSNNVTGFDFGLVIKSCANADAQYNVIRATRTGAATSAGLYFKGSQPGCVAKHNTVYAPDSGMGIEAAASNAVKFTNAVCTYNWIISPTNAVGINWGASASDLGGCTVDYNTYFFSGAVQVGSRNGGTTATSIEQWRTNWSGYSVAGNESHSWYGPTMNAGFAQ